MRRLIQLIPSHHARDAAGAEVMVIERLLGSAGWRVETYADSIDPGLEERTKPFTSFPAGDLSDALVLYHYCAASEMTWRFAELDCPKAIIYHNITPAHFFEPYDESLAVDCREGRRQLVALAEWVDLAVAHSEYSRRDLEEAGFDVTRTIPYLFDPSGLPVEPDSVMSAGLAGLPNVLFVGRVVPNKAPHDFIRTAAAYAAAGYQPARFVLAGKKNALPPYARELEALVQETGLGPDRLLLTDELSREQLVACYKAASIYLCLSRHEGFCVPLLECMFFGVPVLALAEAAVPETLAGAGLLLDGFTPEAAAANVAMLLAEPALRQALIEKGRVCLRRYGREHWGFVLRVLLEQLK